ncbi:MAG: hypothetical protein VB051_00720 [Candidatus Pelethousia sp.]|nr:hypothetical protein [Candidatus Pelethousia sp.]
MRKYRLFCLLAALLALLFVGCSKDEEADVVRVDLSQAGQGGFSGMPSGDMPSFDGMPTGGELPSDERPSGDLTQTQGGRQGGRQNADEDAVQGEGAGGQGGDAMAQQDDGNTVYGRIAAIVGNKVTLTLGTRDESGTLVYGEETAEYLLPVGMAIGTGDFSSVTKGMTLRITLETPADGSENITGVSIVSR